MRLSSKIEPSEFFIPSTYTDSTGRELPCFLVTKKGCEFIANKLTGEKGTKFTALYVTRFNIMEEREKVAIGGKTAKSGKTPEELAAADQTGHGDAAQRQEPGGEFPSKALRPGGHQARVSGNGSQRFLFRGGDSPPPHGIPGHEHTYDKSAIAEKLGVYSKASGGKVPHAQAIGAIISTLDISEDERERLPYCNNGHDGVDYQYTESVVEKVRTWIEAHGRPSTITVNGKNYAVVYRERS